jgi:prepilin-type N-terminal cleavage/methylation domain-containing protein
MLKGFSLGEVIVTVSIIGVIAALTLPNLNINNQKQQVGPILVKAINNLENANRMVLLQREIRTINEDGGDIGYITALADCLNASYDGSFVLKGKDGITYTFSNSFAGGNFYGSRKYSGTYYDVGIDINGDKLPNRANSDRFWVHVDTRGAVIPAGSYEGARYFGENRYSAMKEACTGDVYAKDSEFGICTGAIVDTGWELNYTPSTTVAASDGYSELITPGS